MLPTSWEIVFHVHVVRDVSCVRSCGREICLFLQGCVQNPCCCSPVPRRCLVHVFIFLHFHHFSRVSFAFRFGFFKWSKESAQCVHRWTRHVLVKSGHLPVTVHAGNNFLFFFMS